MVATLYTMLIPYMLLSLVTIYFVSAAPVQDEIVKKLIECVTRNSAERYHATVDDTGQLIVSPVGRDYLDTKGQDEMFMMCLLALGKGLDVLLVGKYEDDE